MNKDIFKEIKKIEKEIYKKRDKIELLKKEAIKSSDIQIGDIVEIINNNNDYNPEFNKFINQRSNITDIKAEYGYLTYYMDMLPQTRLCRWSVQRSEIKLIK